MTAREQVIAALGGRCSWCQTPTGPFEIDHVAGGGNVQRRHLTKKLEYWLVDEHARTVVQVLGHRLVDVRERPNGLPSARLTGTGRPSPGAARGVPVAVTLGDDFPVGDPGNPRTDARVLLAMLLAHGRAAELLRDHGVDEDAVRRLTSDQ